MTIKDIVDKINDGKYDEVSKEDLVALAKATQEAESGKANTNDEKWKGLDATKLADEMKTALDEFRKSPQGQEKLKETLINSRSQRFTAQYGPFFKAILAGADIATSLNQINIAQRSFNRLVKPTIPPPPGVDPRLDYALRQAEQGTSAAPQAANVAKADIFDQYLQDIRNAGTAGGGQQSTFGALAQTAAERRNRGLARLIPLTNDVQMQREAIHNQLLQERGRQTQYNYGNRLEAAGMEFNQYNKEATVAGALGAQGRLNLRQTLGGISDLAPQLASRMYPVSNPYLNKKSKRATPEVHRLAHPFNPISGFSPIKDINIQRSTQAGVFSEKAAAVDDYFTNSLATHIGNSNYMRSLIPQSAQADQQDQSNYNYLDPEIRY